MQEKLKAIESEALSATAAVSGSEDLEQLRVKYLGRKGLLTQFLREISSLPEGERPAAGRLANEIKNRLQDEFQKRLAAIGAGAVRGRESIDVTLPGIAPEPGRRHPLTRTIERICSIFTGLGYEVVEGPEVEGEYYNFEALNIAADHPDRDAFATFYVGKGLLLRSHTSPVQVRVMEMCAPPLKIVVPGRVYRPDAVDASHSFMFHQVEGLAVGPDISFADLKGTLTVFNREMFGPETRTRFRPHFFPFTEPSAEVDISCNLCQGKGCRVCGGKGWVEIMGCGMVDPAVFAHVNYDPEKLSGFAFGMGVERITMLRHNIDDIRLFFENDLRFLEQF